MNIVTTRRTLIAALLAIFAFANAPTLSADHGPGYVWRNVEIVGGGYVPGIVFNAKEPGLVYARTDIGGAYRLDTKTHRWIPLLDWVSWDDWNLTGVDSLATDPVDPDRVYVLAGTYTNDWAAGNGAILRSRDRGRTWRRSDLPFKSGGNMPGRNMGERLAIDPNDDSILYLGTRSGNGLWRSGDYGKTWSKVTSFPVAGAYAPDPGDTSGYSSDPIGIVWVVFDPRTSSGGATQTLYVGVADLGTSIYRSTDGGATWSALPGQPTSPAFMPHHAVLASNGMMYITYNNNAGPYDGSMGDVWKYDTGSATWTRINPDLSTSTNSWFGYGGLAVDAQHPDTVMVAALNEWWPDVNIWRSTDGGATWKAIWDWGPWPDRFFHYVQDISGAPWLTFNSSPGLPEVTPKLGWMVGDLEIDPFNSDRMLYGTGATIYGSDNLTSWDSGNPIDIGVEAQGLEETSVQDLISPPSGAHLLSALGDIGGFRHDDLSVVPSKMYDNPTDSTTTSLDFAEKNPAFIFRVGQGGSANAAHSSDGGPPGRRRPASPGAAGLSPCRPTGRASCGRPAAGPCTPRWTTGGRGPHRPASPTGPASRRIAWIPTASTGSAAGPSTSALTGASASPPPGPSRSWPRRASDGRRPLRRHAGRRLENCHSSVTRCRLVAPPGPSYRWPGSGTPPAVRHEPLTGGADQTPVRSGRGRDRRRWRAVRCGSWSGRRFAPCEGLRHGGSGRTITNAL